MKKYITPILISVGILFISSLISSILYYFNITSEKINSILLYIISIISIFTGSLLIAKNVNKKGIISGLIYFIVWIILSLIISLIVFKTSFKMSNFIYYIVLLLFSLSGGIIGKNKQKETA